jgi:hypothetical protein
MTQFCEWLGSSREAISLFLKRLAPSERHSHSQKYQSKSQVSLSFIHRLKKILISVLFQISDPLDDLFLFKK